VARCTECKESIRLTPKEKEQLIQIGDVDDLEEAYGDLYKETE